MLDVAESRPCVGPSPEFIKSEILRVGAPPAEICSALALVAGGARIDPRAYDKLTPRMRRLVDLLAVAGDQISVSLDDATSADPTEV